MTAASNRRAADARETLGQKLAGDGSVTMIQNALAWQFQNEYVDAPIVGTTSLEHLEQAVEALDVDLHESDVAYLEEPYEPQPVVGI